MISQGQILVETYNQSLYRKQNACLQWSIRGSLVAMTSSFGVRCPLHLTMHKSHSSRSGLSCLWFTGFCWPGMVVDQGMVVDHVFKNILTHHRSNQSQVQWFLLIPRVNPPCPAFMAPRFPSKGEIARLTMHPPPNQWHCCSHHMPMKRGNYFQDRSKLWLLALWTHTRGGSLVVLQTDRIP